MTQRRFVIALWLTFAFVTWNVVFDRRVADAALAFTREQIMRYQEGAAGRSNRRRLQPDVWSAALHASLYAGAVLAVRRGRASPVRDP